MPTRTTPGHTGAVDEWRTDEQERRVDPPWEGVVFSEQTEPSEEPGSLPEQLIDRYVTVAILRAVAEELDDGNWFVETPPLQGVYGEGGTEDEALNSFGTSLREWVVLKVQRRHGDIPVLAGINLNRG